MFYQGLGVFNPPVSRWRWIATKARNVPIAVDRLAGFAAELREPSTKAERGLPA